MARGKIPIAVAYGDGIGPEIMEAVLYVLQEAGAPLDYHPVEIGEKVYLRGHPTGIEAATWETLRRTKAFLKAPITTPQGGGFKSLNVTIRTALGLYANIRPATSYHPFIQTKHPEMDLVIVRENEEDLYIGLEYKLTPDVSQTLKIISRPGTEKIIRYAFEYARHYGRKKVTCFTKDNIMKFTDGLFHKVFEEIAKEYAEIATEHWIVDIGSAKLAETPEIFDVLVLPNLYGDILSDVAAQISGSVGLAGSANIGDHGAMFEAIHGSAPKRAGKNSANPSGLLHAAIYMLAYLGEGELAGRIHNAWLCAIENGIHTDDIFKEGVSKQKVGTKEFGAAVAKLLGGKPKIFKPVQYASHKKLATLALAAAPAIKRDLVGVDIFLFSKLPLQELQHNLAKLATPLVLKMISNRGARVWPEGQPETFCVDLWCCRYRAKNDSHIPYDLVVSTLKQLSDKGFEIIKTENLYLFDGQSGFSSAQG